MCQVLGQGYTCGVVKIPCGGALELSPFSDEKRGLEGSVLSPTVTQLLKLQSWVKLLPVQGQIS